MKAVKLQLATRTLLNPAAPQWARVPAEEINLGGTPIHLQPSRYIRTVWALRPIGAVRYLKVQAAHNSHDIAFRLEWADESENRDYGDGSVFPDAAGILFPLNSDAPLHTMGSADAPVAAWYWRASAQEPQELTARGLGTVEPAGHQGLQARAQWSEGRWALTFARPLVAQELKLASATTTKVAFAVWEGSSQERAGLKAFSRHWRELVIE